MPRSREYSVDSFTHSVLKPKRVLMERAGGFYCKAVSNAIAGAGSLGVTSSHLWCWWRGTDQYLAALFTRTASWVLKWFFFVCSFSPLPHLVFPPLCLKSDIFCHGRKTLEVSCVCDDGQSMGTCSAIIRWCCTCCLSVFLG